MYKDFKELLSLFNEHKVKYLAVGGYAVSFHAQPRANIDKLYFNGIVDRALFTAHMAWMKIELPLKPLKIKWEGTREELRGREHRRNGLTTLLFQLPATARMSLINMKRCRSSVGDGAKPKCR